MACDDARVFALMAKCFAEVDERDWSLSTAESSWAPFLSAVRSLLQGDRLLGEPASAFPALRHVDPLQEFLAEREVSALFAPPTFAEKKAFAARHFTGGLPDSALPVESLYVEWTTDPTRGPFASRDGLYLGDTALYMRDLLESLGLRVPPAFHAAPDHLSLELDVLSYLLEQGLNAEASEFLSERFAWCTAYRLRLVELGERAVFPLAVVDALLGIRVRQEEAKRA